MPIYEYQCLQCGVRNEALQKMGDPPLTTCERCGGALKRLISSPAVQFKGSGWYVTDYARRGSGGKSGGDGGKSEGAGGESKAEKSGGDGGGGAASGGSEGSSSGSSGNSDSGGSSSGGNSSGSSSSGTGTGTGTGGNAKT